MLHYLICSREQHVSHSGEVGGFPRVDEGEYLLEHLCVQIVDLHSVLDGEGGGEERGGGGKGLTVYI